MIEVGQEFEGLTCQRVGPHPDGAHVCATWLGDVPNDAGWFPMAITKYIGSQIDLAHPVARLNLLAREETRNGKPALVIRQTA